MCGIYCILFLICFPSFERPHDEADAGCAAVGLSHCFLPIFLGCAFVEIQGGGVRVSDQEHMCAKKGCVWANSVSADTECGAKTHALLPNVFHGNLASQHTSDAIHTCHTFEIHVNIPQPTLFSSNLHSVDLPFPFHPYHHL